MAKKRANNRDKTPPTPPIEDVPPPPSCLTGDGRDYWLRITPILVQAKLLSDAHLESLTTLCEAWHEYRLHQDWIQSNPDELTFTTETGYEAESPRIRLRNRALDTLQKLWAKFGMTPKALADLGKMKSGGGQVPAIVGFAASKYEDEA